MAEIEKIDPVKEVDELVQKGLVCLEEFRKLNQEQVDYIVSKVSVAVLDEHEKLAKLAIEETGRGVFEDKCTKNLFACEYVVNAMRHLKTCGIISDDPVTGVTEVADPLGVICGITPVTNPTSTVIFKCLILAVCKQIAAMGNCRVPEQNECRDNSCATGYGGKGCDFTMCRCYKPISINCGDKYKPINNVNDGNSQKKYSGFGDELCGMCC